MPAVSKKQQKFFRYLLSNPEERKKKGISKKAAKAFASDVQEVAPPGWGHTKAEKEKTKPDKPKSEIGGSSAAFDRARKEGRFKGSKEDMFKLMWWMYNKGGKPKGKPHYIPGTKEKYKKYQDKDETNESLSVKDVKKLAKASALSQSNDPKDQERARARQTEIDYKDLLDQRKKGKVGVGKSMKVDVGEAIDAEHRKAELTYGPKTIRKAGKKWKEFVKDMQSAKKKTKVHSADDSLRNIQRK